MKKRRTAGTVAEIETYSDALLMAILKRRRPDRYGDCSTVEVNIRHDLPGWPEPADFAQMTAKD